MFKDFSFVPREEELSSLFLQPRRLKLCSIRQKVAHWLCSIDLVAQFEEQYSHDRMEILGLLPNTILYKSINEKEALSDLRADEHPQLLLNTFPVEYDWNFYAPFFGETLLRVIHNM